MIHLKMTHFAGTLPHLVSADLALELAGQQASERVLRVSTRQGGQPTLGTGTRRLRGLVTG